MGGVALRKKRIIISIAIIVGLILIGFGLLIPNECNSELIFTVSPLDIEDIREILPLGSLSPPSHTFPTDHIYFIITRQEGADKPDHVTVYSPGDLIVTTIRATEHVNADFTDYVLFLKPLQCSEITIMFIHISSLAKEIFGDTSSYSEWTLDAEYTTGDEIYRTRSKNCNINVNAGEVLGTAGGNPGQWALDLGVYDPHHLPENIANPERWSPYRYLHTVCPLNFYEEGPVRNSLQKLVYRDDIEEDPTLCGSVLQDIPGTTQGCWFLLGVTETYPEDPHLALVHSNIHPNLAVLSVGNSIPNLESKRYEVLPKDLGLLNRDFREITPDGTIYGFTPSNFDGVIIVQMPDATTLWIEAIMGDVIEPISWIFTENKTIFER